MSIAVFSIAFLILMLGMVWLLWSSSKSLPVVKAGKVTKYCHKSKCFFGYSPKKVVVNGKEVDLSGYKQMIVSGNSMKNYQIIDGQRIFVRELSMDEKQHISTYPVLVFHIVNPSNGKDAEYKLRKFVGYVESTDWGDIYSKYQGRIKISSQMFIDDCSRKCQSMESDDALLVLSETYDEDLKSERYSLHPVSSVYGKVEYAL